MTFHAKPGEEYTIDSIHKWENNKIIDIEFKIINRGKPLKEFKSEKIQKATPVYIPIYI